MERDLLISLVTRAQKGDSSAMDKLFSEFYNDVYYFALKTLKDADTACDITQETFLEIINTIGNLKEPAAFVTWMKQITYHQCTRYFKKKKEVLVEEDEDGNTIFDTLADESEGSIPSEVYEKEEFRNTIIGIINELTEEQRSAVMMYYFEELTVGQIAQIQGVSEGTVKSRLNYARKAIKKSVKAYEKKHDIKLHSFAILPLFMLFFGKEFMPAAKAAEIQTVVAETAGTVGTGAAAAAESSAAVTTASAKATAATGFAAKIAAAPLAAKIVAGVLAAAVAVGGGAALLGNARNNRENTQKDNSLYQDDVPAGSTYESVPTIVVPEETVAEPDWDYTNHLREGQMFLYGVKTISFTNVSVPDGVQPEDVSYLEDGSILMWKEPAAGQEDLYHMYITAADGGVIYTPEDCSRMFADAQELETIQFDNFNTTHTTNMGEMFDGCIALSSMDISGFDTSGVTDMRSMFLNCQALTTADVSGFDTSKVTNMQYMFGNCMALATLDVSGFDTSMVMDMNYMFGNCMALATLDVSNFDTSAVTDMRGMFFGCEQLQSLQLSNFDTAKVTDMEVMFAHCFAITNLDVSGFNTANVETFNGMFERCEALETVDVSGFDTAKAWDMSYMFHLCRSLKELDVSGFQTSNAVVMDGMFSHCYALTSLDVSGFDTANVESMNGMFSYSNKLNYVDVSGWNTAKVTDMDSIFSGCSLLRRPDISGWKIPEDADLGLDG